MSPRVAFVLRRLGLMIPSLIALSIFVFALIRLVPGDPARTMLGFRATPKTIAIVRHDLRLDESLPAQYWHWITGVVHGNLGQDYVSGAPVGHLIVQTLPITLELVFLAMLVALLIGVPLGVLAASGSRVAERISSGFVVGGIALPDFWLGTLLVLVFAEGLGILPPIGWVPISGGLGQNLKFLVLPVMSLATGEAAYILRTTRGSMLDTLGQPFVAFLHAKGLSKRRIVFRHALRNAAVPIITVVGIQFGVLLGASIVIETIFGLPGVARLVVTAIEQRNYTVVQGSVMTIATLFILVNLITDLAYGWLDPRVGEGGA